MKKIIISIAVLISLSSVRAFADNVGAAVPVNQFGNEANVSYAGAKVAILASSAVTTTELLIVAAPCVVYGVVYSSANTASGAYVVLNDTHTLGAVAAHQLMPRIYFPAATKTETITFDPPIRFSHGVTSVYTAASSGPGRVSLLYLEK